jgi:hypothetical protein
MKVKIKKGGVVPPFCVKYNGKEAYNDINHAFFLLFTISFCTFARIFNGK